MSTESACDDGPDARGPRRSGKHVLIAFGVLAWLAGIALGVQKIQSYSTTAGVVAETPAEWPGSSLIVPQSGRATLVMFMHPQCSCTRASLEELRAVLSVTRDSVSAWIVVLHPPGMSADWARSSTWDAARHMSGVTVVSDMEGAEGDRFGALTSGHTVLYDASGRLLFSGGITMARGHVGDNAGRERVVSLARTGAADGHTHEVYGCGLHDPHPRVYSEASAAP